MAACWSCCFYTPTPPSSSLPHPPKKEKAAKTSLSNHHSAASVVDVIIFGGKWQDSPSPPPLLTQRLPAGWKTHQQTPASPDNLPFHRSRERVTWCVQLPPGCHRRYQWAFCLGVPVVHDFLSFFWGGNSTYENRFVVAVLFLRSPLPASLYEKEAPASLMPRTTHARARVHVLAFCWIFTSMCVVVVVVVVKLPNAKITL